MVSSCQLIRVMRWCTALLQESKDSYQRETELRHAREVQFLDDFKRAILLNSGHVASLGPEPVDEQLEICPGDPTGSKIRLLKAQPGGRGGGGRGDREGGSSRLLAMKAAFSMEDEEEDDEDDEWDPLQVLKDSPDEFEEDVMSLHHAGTSSPEQKWKPAATKTPPVPTSREEERAMLARAMRYGRRLACMCPPLLVFLLLAHVSLRHVYRLRAPVSYCLGSVALAPCTTARAGKPPCPRPPPAACMGARA